MAVGVGTGSQGRSYDGGNGTVVVILVIVGVVGGEGGRSDVLMAAAQRSLDLC